MKKKIKNNSTVMIKKKPTEIITIEDDDETLDHYEDNDSAMIMENDVNVRVIESPKQERT